MLEAIGSAQRTIDFSSYIYWPGEVTGRFTDALTERARSGVEVNIVLDGYGSAKLDRDHVGTLERSGARVTFLRPPKWYTVHKLNKRMHRRLLIVDGTLGFAGATSTTVPSASTTSSTWPSPMPAWSVRWRRTSSPTLTCRRRSTCPVGRSGPYAGGPSSTPPTWPASRSRNSPFG